MKRIYLWSIIWSALLFTSCISKNEGIKGIKHVVVVGYDGLASSTIEAAQMPVLKQLMKEGASTLHSRSILPSSSACNWASLLMGVGPEIHGYNTWGSRKPDFPSMELSENGIFPTINTVLRRHNPNLHLCTMYEWEVIGDLIDRKAVNFEKHIPMGEKRSRDIVNAFTTYLKEQKPNFAMCVFDSPDAEGHGQGWGSDAYMKRLTELDTFLAEIIETTKEAGTYEETIFFVVSDHGGINHGHGSTSMEEMETPFVVFGPKVKKGHTISSAVLRYDTAPTIAYIFGATTPNVWRGKAITEIFEEK